MFWRGEIRLMYSNSKFLRHKCWGFLLGIYIFFQQKNPNWKLKTPSPNCFFGMENARTTHPPPTFDVDFTTEDGRIFTPFFQQENPHFFSVPYSPEFTVSEFWEATQKMVKNRMGREIKPTAVNRYHYTKASDFYIYSLSMWWFRFFGILLPPGKLTCPLKNDGWKMNFDLGWSLFRWHVKFQGGTFCGNYFHLKDKMIQRKMMIVEKFHQMLVILNPKSPRK